MNKYIKLILLTPILVILFLLFTFTSLLSSLSYDTIIFLDQSLSNRIRRYLNPKILT